MHGAACVQVCLALNGGQADGKGQMYPLLIQQAHVPENIQTGQQLFQTQRLSGTPDDLPAQAQGIFPDLPAGNGGQVAPHAG